MTTTQLIILWLGGLGVAALLALRLGTGGQAASLALLTGMLIYSFRPHPHASMRKVAAVVIIAGACGLGASYSYVLVRARAVHRTEQRRNTAVEQEEEGFPIDPKAVRVFDLKYSFLVRELSGRIENNSGRGLKEVVLHVSFYDGQTLVDEGDCTVLFGIEDPLPPGETHSFAAVCPRFDAPESASLRVSHSVRSVRALTQ